MQILPAPFPSHRFLVLRLSALQLITSFTYAATDIANNNISNAALAQRDVEFQNRLAGQSPVGVRKMTDDEGEKFWLDFWYFDDVVVGGSAAVGQQQQSNRRGRRGNDEEFGGLREHRAVNRPDNQKIGGLGDGMLNISIASSYPPFPLHGNAADEGGENQDNRGGRGGMSFPLLGRSLSRWWLRDGALVFGRRNFNCPADTEPCISINRPNSCCGAGSKCIFVKDTGLGDVGCCRVGDTCSGDLIECAEGYRPCPHNPGGGCCIPGYSCVDQGCIYISTITVTATPALPPPPPPSSPPTTTTTNTKPVNPPLRPTSNPIATTTIAPPPPPTPTITGCPTGFYACSAAYHGGCCRTGRDCNPTSCPTISSTTIVDGNGATIVVPVDPNASGSSSSGGQAGRRCAGGWTSCAASAGGGCCPDGDGDGSGGENGAGEWGGKGGNWGWGWCLGLFDDDDDDDDDNVDDGRGVSEREIW
ncbi:hypothetical protein ACJ72_02161 [Emergomyces africanus]|uniref:Granulins domain-containing protein n=1 Tax=Emergomyces africanus TaxID=1955775 RepID=A0A1B7P373_9EURO|nr:hypothetical protein ACJ72_02161 [Emergomyces africanus]